MRTLLIRHAPAGDRRAWSDEGKDDAARALTPEGAKRMNRAVEGLKVLVPRIDLIAASPLLRAAQTADILAAAYPEAERYELPHLSPRGDPEGTLRWLAARDSEAVAALVGHNPALSALLCRLVAGDQPAFIEMKKGAAALVEFNDTPQAAKGLLRWLLQPKALRGLA